MASDIPTISALREMFQQEYTENEVQLIDLTIANKKTNLEIERNAPVSRYDFVHEINFTAVTALSFSLVDIAKAYTNIDLMADTSANLISGLTGLDLLLLNQCKYGLDCMPITVLIDGVEVVVDNDDVINVTAGDVVKIFTVLSYDPAPYLGDIVATDGSFNPTRLNTFYFNLTTDFTTVLPVAKTGTATSTLNATRTELHLSGSLLAAYKQNPSSMILFQKIVTKMEAVNTAMIKNFAKIQTGSVIDAMLITVENDSGDLDDTVIDKFEIEGTSSVGNPRFYTLRWLLAKFLDKKEKRFKNTPTGAVYLDEVIHSGGLNFIQNKSGDFYFNVAAAKPNTNATVSVIYAVRQVSTLPALDAKSRADTDPRRNY